MNEKSFVLHDGEDDETTEKLHEFMGDMNWDGDNSGISIWLDVRIGDTIVIGETEGGDIDIKIKRRRN